MTWILANHFKDEEVEWKKLQLLCRFINPEAARQIFDKETIDPIIEMTEDEFLQEINAHTTEKIDNKTLQDAFKGNITTDQDLDVIVPVEE